MVPRGSFIATQSKSRLAQPAAKRAWKKLMLAGRWDLGCWALVSLMALGVILSSLLYHLLTAREEVALNSSFLRRAERQRMVVAGALREHRDAILVLEGLFRFSTGVEREEFQGAAQQLLLRYPGVHAFQWAPLVRMDDRSEVEFRAREDGIDGFQIRERTPQGEFVPAGIRPVYFPIYYTEPRAGNEMMLGYDLATGTNRAALAIAGKTGQITGSGPLTLAQERSGQLGWILICPVYSPQTDLASPESREAGLLGYVQGVFRMPSMFAAAWEPLQDLGLQTLVLDVTPGTDHRVIYYSPGNSKSPEKRLSEAEIRAGLHTEQNLEIAGRKWILLSRPDPDWLYEQRTQYPGLLCLGGLIITTLLGAYLHLLRSRAEEIRELVAQRTSELASSRDSLQLALQSASMGTWEWDTVTNRLQLSPGLEGLMGIAKGSFTGNMDQWLEWIASEDRTRLRCEIGEIRKTGADFHSEFRIVKPDGERRWLSLNARLFMDHGRKSSSKIIAAIRDITLQKHAEEEIHRRLASERDARLRAERSEQKAEEAVMLLDTIFQTAPVGLAFLDSELRYARVNESLATINGVPADAHLGRTVQEVNPHVAMQATPHHRRVMETGEPVRNFVLTGPRHSPDHTEAGTWIASYYPIKKPDGTVYGLGIVVVDITELRSAEERVHRLAALVEQSTDVVVILSPIGVAEYANGVFSRQSGIPADSVAGMRVEQLTKAVGVENHFSEVVTQISSEGVWCDRIHTTSVNGQQLAFDYTVSPLRDENGIVTNYVVVGRDVTRELVLEDRLRTSQKMEAIGLLAGGIAHDFNNLLQVIEGYTALCLDLPCSPGELTQNLQQVREAASRAAQLTKQLLLFSRRQPLARTELDLYDVTANILKMIRRLIGPQIEVSLGESAGLSAVQADRGQLEQVLLNLCVNARDAMPTGGHLEIQLDEVELDASAAREFPDLKPGRYVRLRVADNGSGISSEMRDRIFEPFFTTKPGGHGTGLGLSVVYGIVQQHEGAISVDSSEGRGTTFHVYLPALGKRARARTPEAEVRFARGSETVLLVEDEDPVRQLTGIVLRQAGYAVIEAADGQEACEIYADRKDEINLVLMDVMMPRMGGLEAWKRIRELREVPILFCSGYTGATGDLPAGAPLLPKPFTSDKLLSVIREVIEGRAVVPGTSAAAK